MLKQRRGAFFYKGDDLKNIWCHWCFRANSSIIDFGTKLVKSVNRVTLKHKDHVNRHDIIVTFYYMNIVVGDKSVASYDNESIGGIEKTLLLDR